MLRNCVFPFVFGLLDAGMAENRGTGVFGMDVIWTQLDLDNVFQTRLTFAENELEMKPCEACGEMKLCEACGKTFSFLSGLDRTGFWVVYIDRIGVRRFVQL